VTNDGKGRELQRRSAAAGRAKPQAAGELRQFNGNKRVQLEHRQEQLVLRDDDHASGAPPRTGVDLDRGTAVLRLPPGKP
jgi:hypothetical protein